MKILNNHDWMMINDMIYRINSIDQTRKMQEDFMQTLCKLVPFDSGAFYLASDFTEDSNPVCLNTPPDIASVYLEHMDEDYTKFLFSLSRSNVCRESDLWSDHERRKEPYYQQMYAPFNVHHAVITCMVHEMEFTGCFCLYRPQEQQNFSDREVFILEILKDHLALSLYKRNHMDSQVSSQTDKFIDEIHLTKKECEVFRFLVEGLSTEEISSRLCISPHTLKNHLQNIYAKAGVQNKLHLLKKAKIF